MFDISPNGIVIVNRGDTFSIDVFVNIGTLLFPIQYVLNEDDKVYFALMEPNQPFEHALIRKVFTKDNLDEGNNVVMDFKPEDTEFLLPGLYYYQVKLVRSTGEVDTIIQKTKFIIND